MSDIAPFSATAAAPRAWRIARALARAAAWLAVAAASVLLLAWLTLYWMILPHIERWRPEIERKTAEAIGVPVQIGAITVRSSAWVPEVELRDVVLLDPQGRTALRLARVLASVSARSVLSSIGSLNLRLAQLLIDGAELELRRDTAGRLFVAGLDFSGPSATGDGDAADWVFRQREVAIRGATLRWTDELRGTPPLTLTAVELVVRNSLRRHDLRLDATPPAAWGDRLSVRGAFTQPLLEKPGRWQRWSGEAYLDAPRLDAGALGRYVDLPFELTRAEGAARGWLEWREGVATAATVDLALQTLELRLAPTLAPLAMQQVQGRITARHQADGGSLSLKGFGFHTADGLQWQPGDLTLGWTRGPDGALRGGELEAGRIDLALVAHAGSRLPLGQATLSMLAAGRPRGIAHDVQAGWQGPLDAPTSYRVRTRIDGLSLPAGAPASPGGFGRPGLRQASIELTATEQGGEAQLAIRDGDIDLPGVFDEPAIPLQRLDAGLRWRVQPRPGAAPAVELVVTRATVANADIDAAFKATWRSGPGAGDGGAMPGTLDLEGTLSRAAAARTARYLPLAVPAAARSYLQQAVLGGSFLRGSFRVRGALRDFPFTSGPGEFRIATTVDGATFAYLPADAAAAGRPAWPPLTALAGELVIDRGSLSFREARATIDGVAVSGMSGGLTPMAGPSVLTLDGRARGPLSALLRFVANSPVGDWTQGALADATASGDGDLTLALTLPLRAPDQATLRGNLQLAGNDLRLRRELPVLASARGRVDFTNAGVTLVGTRARVFGGDTVLDGGTQPDGTLRFSAQGTVTAAALRDAPELGALARGAGVLSGQAAYRLTLGLGRGVPEVELTSDLVGLASSLPAPLAKAAASAMPLRFQTTLAPKGPGGLQDVLRLEIGSLLRARFERDLSGATPRVLRGAIGVGEAPPLPARGVVAAMTLPMLDLDAWLAIADRWDEPAGAGTPRAAPTGYAPTRIDLRLQSLQILGRRLTALSAGLVNADGEWQATIDADQLQGRIDFRPPEGGADGAGTGRVRARLARLSLPPGEAEAMTELLDRQPAEVPALDIVIDALELRGRNLGRLEVQAVNRMAPVRQWELTRLTLRVPEARLSASGRWAAVAGSPRRRADYHFELDIGDSGALLDRLGVPGAVRGGKGRIDGDLAWLGSPLALDPPSLDGRIHVAIDQGQFLQVQPGAARLLSVLSLQSLGRRLSGDFRDLFQQGFAFDTLIGDVSIASGVAQTDNLRMSGSQAVVAMAGQADIARETQDLRVVVVPQLDAAGASLAVAAINPLAGLGTFVAQMLLREPLAQASTREFRITGPWADPLVEPVARGAGVAPAPDAGGASSGQR